MIHPGLKQHRQLRSLQDRAADGITRWCGSMSFVYIHIVWFVAWIVCAVEDYPYGLLTMIVSLEAIFLSTFVLISQNRADSKRSAIANHDHEVDCASYELLKRIALERGIEP